MKKSRLISSHTYVSGAVEETTEVWENPNLIAPVCRIQLRRTKGWRMPPNTMIVDRRTKWGNPFKVGVVVTDEKIFEDTMFGEVDEILINNTEEAVESYEILIKELIELEKLDLSEITGKNLACWCGLDKPCHADILLQLANNK